MKLIIDIPDDIQNTIESDEFISREQLAVLQMHILNGIPLEKIRDEILEWRPLLYPFVDHEDAYLKKKDVLKIIDKYTKGEKE
jgi:hypothetical protein